MHAAAVEHGGCGAQVFDTRVGAGPDEHAIDRNPAAPCRAEPHVAERLRSALASLGQSAEPGTGMWPSIGAPPRARSPRHHGRDRVSIERHFAIERLRFLTGPPALDRLRQACPVGA